MSSTKYCYNNVLKKVVHLAKNHQLTVFTGSGTSFDSGIPTVESFVKSFMYSMQAGGHDSQFKQAFCLPKQYTLQYPFHYVMALIKQATSEASFSHLLDIFDEKKHAYQPNKIHRCIAKLASEGYLNTIYTTNFDRMIECALDEYDVDYRVYFKASDMVVMNCVSSKPTLVKLHGCISQKSSVLSTIDMIGQTFVHADRLKPIKRCFQSNRLGDTVLVLGYGFSDHFDVNHVMKQIDDGDQKRMIIIHHGVQDGARLDGDRIELLNGWANIIQIYVNTTQFIDDVWKGVFKTVPETGLKRFPCGRIIHDALYKWKEGHRIQDIKKSMLRDLHRYDDMKQQTIRAYNVCCNVLGPHHRITKDIRKNLT